MVIMQDIIRVILEIQNKIGCMPMEIKEPDQKKDIKQEDILKPSGKLILKNKFLTSKDIEIGYQLRYPISTLLY